jgi:hypothetical protein
LTGWCPNKNFFERSLKRISDLNCLSPKGEFSNRLERALDLSKNVLDQAKRDLGNSLLTFSPENDLIGYIAKHER